MRFAQVLDYCGVQEWAVSQDDDLTVLVCDYVGAGA
jgi:hypothetical protein